jgi:hypothetical protein
MMKNILLPPYKVDPFVINNNNMDMNVHIVSTALKKGGFCLHYLGNRGMSTYQIADFCDSVNHKPEVGTLHPKFSFSFLPVKYIPENISASTNIYMKDIFKAHREYYKKCTSMLFVIDKDSGYPLNDIQSILQNSINENLNGDNSVLSTIDFFYTIYP